MQFAEFPVYDAEGAELSVPVRTKDKTFEKGHVLTSSDIGILRYAGVKSIIGVKYAPVDIHPETASEILLKSLLGDHMRCTLPDKSGYSDIFADADGTLMYEPERLLRFNSHSENISLMMMSPYLPVFKGQLIGNLRIFGPALNATELNEAVAKVTGTGPLIKTAPYAFCRIGYIQTVLPHHVPERLDEKALDERFAVYGFHIAYHDICEHSPDRIEHAVRNAIDAKAEIVLVQSPVAPQSRDDIVPKAFKEASGDIDRLGWPLDEGLSIVIAHRDMVKLIGFCETDVGRPGYERLMRLLATRSLPAPDQFPSLAQAGLSLDRMTMRITPEQMKNSAAVGAISDSSKIAIVILAAGQSARMIGANKLMESINGIPIIEIVVRNALRSKADFVTVVTGHEAIRIERRLANYDVKIIRNPDYVSGILGSVRMGLAVLPPDIAGAVVLPGDMPAFSDVYINKLIENFDPKAGRKAVCLPSYNGVRHNPVLWPRELFKAVKIVPEDAHWTPALLEHSDYIKELVLDDDYPLSDINTKGDLEKYIAHTEQVVNAEAEKELLALEGKL